MAYNKLCYRLLAVSVVLGRLDCHGLELED